MVSKQSVDPSVRQAVERISTMYKECFNKQDAAGVARVFTKDGVLSGEWKCRLLNAMPKPPASATK
jgi:hypothetical protein